MPEKNWIVPVALGDGYWNARLYVAAYETAEQAKRAAQASLAGLATYVKPPQPFIVGAPEELT